MTSPIVIVIVPTKSGTNNFAKENCYLSLYSLEGSAVKPLACSRMRQKRDEGYILARLAYTAYALVKVAYAISGCYVTVGILTKIMPVTRTCETMHHAHESGPVPFVNWSGSFKTYYQNRPAIA